MGELDINVPAVLTLAAGVLDAADQIAEIDWPTMASTALSGSATYRATSSPSVEERLARVVAEMRSWATSARGSAAAFDTVEGRHARRLDDVG